MNFAAFVEWKAKIKRDRPHVVDVSETRIAHALRELRPSFDPMPAVRVHRCDLARTWCAVRGLPDACAPRALVCEGVRHGLSIILGALGPRTRVAIPRDVYPVYWQIAADTGVVPLAIDTFPTFDVESVLAGVATEGASIALLPSPLKLHGRRWTLEEAAFASRWLGSSPNRRLILDGVYSFGRELDEPTRMLLDTGRVLYLDSLSKGWLHEKVFGVALVPQEDLELFGKAFQSLAPRQESLALAGELLGAHAGLPGRLDATLARARTELAAIANRAGLPLTQVETGYLAAVGLSAETVLERFGLVTIPVSVFGGDATDHCVASALPAR